MSTPDFYIKQNDTSPSLLVDLTGSDLTGATVIFHMRRKGANTVKVESGATTIVTANPGQVRYDWAAADTDTAGDYEGEFEVTFADATIESYPNTGFIEILITEEVS